MMTRDSAAPLVDEALAAGVRLYNLTGLEDGKYYWRVCSRNEYGAEGTWSGSRSFVVDTQSPDEPILYSPKDLFVTADTTPSLRVIRVKDAKQYHFQVWENETLIGDPLPRQLSLFTIGIFQRMKLFLMEIISGGTGNRCCRK